MKHKGKIKQTKKPHKDTRICSLCFETEKEKGEKVQMYVGGFCGMAHKNCMEIACQGISLYEKYVLFHYKILPDYQKKKGIKNEI